MKKTIPVSLVAAALIVGTSLGLRYLVATGSLEDGTSRRTMGALIGLVLAVWGNYMPKMLEPPSRRCDSARWVALRRFAGWAFAVAGLSYAAIWIWAPVAVASTWSTSIVAASLVLVVVPFVWLVISRRGSGPSASA